MIALIRLTPHGYHSLVPNAGAVVVVALIGALSAVELLRPYGSPGAERWRRRLQVAAIPLAVLGVLVVAARLAPLAA